MKIDILCNDGSPLGVTSKTVWGDAHRVGVGGSELALITLCEEWTKAGYEVVLYNNPYEPSASPFEQKYMHSFDVNGKRDVLIIWRSPNIRSIPVDNCLKVWLSHDQRTVGDFKQFASSVHKIVGISDFHKKYFESEYGINNMIVIDIPIRIEDYQYDVPKDPNKIIFTSIPDRGLDKLHRMWPAIRKRFPDVYVTITSDYRLWGAGAANNNAHRAMWVTREGINFVGAVNRKQLIHHQKTASIHLYPCTYDELFCIAVAESQVARTYTITSGCGALPTTNMGKLLMVDVNDPRNDVHFIDALEEYMKGEANLNFYEKALERFSPGTVLKQWEELVFNG